MRCIVMRGNPLIRVAKEFKQKVDELSRTANITSAEATRRIMKKL